MRDIAMRSDVVLPGLEEAELMTSESDPEKAVRAIQQLGPGMVVVKLGADGALALTDGQLTHSPAMKLERIIDPVGAGDAFAAGLLTGLLRGFSIDAALALANRCGALATTTHGDMESLPTWQEVTAESLADVRR
jgi:2-dehydro-3-deoxygluconokinase